MCVLFRHSAILLPHVLWEMGRRGWSWSRHRCVGWSWLKALVCFQKIFVEAASKKVGKWYEGGGETIWITESDNGGT